MTDDEKSKADQITAAINHNSQWIGQTTRELRDKVEIAAKQIEDLSRVIGEVSQRQSSDLQELTAAINRYSVSSDKLAGRMILLTAILAIATVISAVATCLSAIHH
jgi:hypothetical protein